MYLASDVEACQGLHVRKRDGLLAEIGNRDSYFEIFGCSFDVRAASDSRAAWSISFTVFGREVRILQYPRRVGIHCKAIAAAIPIYVRLRRAPRCGE
eukprot:scaffold1837_cov102-Isochrysis_galbana.AAC.1